VPYPIYFLNDARAPTPDSRASSLQSALHFASRWGLDGIVLESTPLIACPRLVHLAKAKGLGLATYGARNNEPWFVRLQRENNVRGIIVDRVKHIIMDCQA
jgi:glycerophosphodiester phosphodiesterase